MKKARPLGAACSGRLVTVSLLATLLASCTSAGDQQFAMQSPGFAAQDAAVAAVESEADAPAAKAETAAQTDFAAPEAQRQTPSAIAKPTATPNGAAQAQVQQASLTTPDSEEELDGLKSKKPSGPEALASATPPNLIDGKKRAFLSSFFANDGKAPGRPAPAARPLIQDNAPLGAKPERQSREKAKPIIRLASAGNDGSRSASAAFALDGDDNDLPGVRQTMLFEIKRKSGIDDESDVDVHEEDDLGPVQVASAAGMARLAPNGLLKQTETVDTACLKPALVRTLKKAEAYFGKRLILTSGYRSPEYNRKVRGAKRSMHMYCAAADVQMPGVSKWELANYFRAQPDRGGVGTYCSTQSIHVDVGPERDWNWKCGRRS